MCNGNTEMSPPIPMQNPICTETQLGFDVAFALPNYNFYIPELRHLRNEETTVHYCAEIMVPLQLKMESSVNTNFG